MSFAKKQPIVTGDVCVIGSGFCAYAVTVTLASAGFRVIVLPGGPRWRRRQSLYRGEVAAGRHSPLHQYRSRRLGGTSDVWGGRVASFDAEDFVPVDGVRSPWPVSYQEMASAYARAAHLLEVEAVHEYEWERELCGIESTGPTEDPIRGDWLWLFSPPTKLATRWMALKDHPQIELIPDAHALFLEPEAEFGGREFSHIIVKAFRYRHFRGTVEFGVRSKRTVLAAGGLETTRLLLLLDQVAPGLIAGREWLGRGYMSHISGHAGPAEIDVSVPRGYLTRAGATYARPAWRLAPKLVAGGRLNFRANVDLPPTDDPSHRSAALSAFELMKLVLTRRVPPEFGDKSRHSVKTVAAHSKNILIGFPRLISLTLWWVTKRYLKYRRLPSLPPDQDARIVGVHFDAEQSSSSESYVELGQDVDNFGLPILRVHHDVKKSDFQDVEQSIQELDAHLQRTGLGRLLSEPSELAARIRLSGVGSHHLGTTRAADHFEHGVLDRYGCVFGTSSLYVCAASAFPTTGVANPTFQAVAWSYWVADYLVRSMTRSTSDLS